jgi:hypothetical protein
MPKRPGILDRGGTLRACCARGRAHFAVADAAVLAVNERLFHGQTGGVFRRPVQKKSFFSCTKSRKPFIYTALTPVIQQQQQ